MPGQAVVTIGENSWAVSVASSTTELVSGLSGVASIAPGTGILFDMGSDQSYIEINMADMLFALDIVFINSENGVVGILRDVAPGEAAAFDAGGSLGSRYFLEVNAGDAEDVSVGDHVDISGGVQPSFWAGFMSVMVALPIVAGSVKSTYDVIKGKEPTQ